MIIASSYTSNLKNIPQPKAFTLHIIKFHYTFQKNGRFIVRFQGSLFKTINIIDLNKICKIHMDKGIYAKKSSNESNFFLVDILNRTF